MRADRSRERHPPAYVTRLEDCGQDCPAPTVAESCAEPSLNSPSDSGFVNLAVDAWNPYSPWEFDCQVLDIVETEDNGSDAECEVPLDCLPLVLIPNNG